MDPRIERPRRPFSSAAAFAEITLARDRRHPEDVGTGPGYQPERTGEKVDGLMLAHFAVRKLIHEASGKACLGIQNHANSRL